VENTAATPFPSWISEDCFITVGKRNIYLKKFLHDSCQQFPDDHYLTAKYAIYYLVIRHQNCVVEESRKVYSNESAIQMYVGYAANGVKERWSQHCRCIKQVLDETHSSRNLHQLICRIKNKSYQLVDAFLALAWLCEFDMALFVVKTFDNDDTNDQQKYSEMQKAEKNLIRLHAANNVCHGLNLRVG